ncbi:MAG: C40 family peptidase [Lachnospiraceae bacterium]|nr:C40 family peptidase [Lachnospiraceae bacterium]
MKYRKNIAYGVTGVALAGFMITGIHMQADAKSNKAKADSNISAEVTIPSAGIAKLLVNNENSAKSNKAEEKNADIELSSGIASILNNYYIDTLANESKVSIKAVDTVLSMLPAEDAEDTKESEATDKAAEEAAQEEQLQQVSSIVAGYNVLGVANVSNYLNVRETPDLDGKVLGKLPMNAGCEILETLDGWYKISSGSVEGYVSAEYILTGEEANERAAGCLATVAKVKADMLMVREEPNTDCTILTRVAYDEELEAVELLDGWVKVNIDNKFGYVSAEYVDVYQTLPKGVTIEELSYGDGISNTAVDLIEYAKQFLGNPYVYGGTSLTNGTDCSGFTMRIFEHFGYGLSRTSREQANNGTRVSLSEIQPGDLLFYSHGGSIGHVAIYIGNGQIIHASTERTGIIIGNAFYTTPVCATRIIN